MTRSEQLLLQCRAMQVMWTPDIEKLVELVRLQHSIVEKYRGQVDIYGQTSCYEAIEAFNKWEGK